MPDEAVLPCACSEAPSDECKEHFVAETHSNSAPQGLCKQEPGGDWEEARRGGIGPEFPEQS